MVREIRHHRIHPKRRCLRREDTLLDIERVAGYGGDCVVAAIDPEESYRHILAFVSAIVGDEELQAEQLLRRRYRRAEAGRMICAVVASATATTLTRPDGHEP